MSKGVRGPVQKGGGGFEEMGTGHQTLVLAGECCLASSAGYSSTAWGVLRAVHKVCTGPYPSCIVVPSTSNSEPCYALI